MRKGLIHLYIGKGEGKTTAAVGLSLRAYGAKRKVCFIQFLKAKESSETAALRRLNIRTVSFKERHPLFYKRTSIENLRKRIAEDLKQTQTLLKDSRYNFVVLDEILYLLQKKFVKEDDIIRLIGLKPSCTELVLTGGYATKAIIDSADYVSTIDDTKHPFKKGVSARPGIEY